MRIYVVQRNREQDQYEAPVIAFTDADDATTHARAVSEATGDPYTVVHVPISSAPPAPVSRHVMRVELDLTGRELWRSDETLTLFSDHRDTDTSNSSLWRIIERSTPSQPPSRVRMDLVGPDRQWCMDAARSAWAAASRSEDYRRAVEVEEFIG